MFAPMVDGVDYATSVNGVATSAVVMDNGAGGNSMSDLGPPHLPLAGMLLALLLLKFLGEHSALSLNPSEVKISLHNMAVVWLMAFVGIVLFKVGNAALVSKMIIIPGLADIAGAL